MKKVISYILLIAMIFSLPLNCYAMDEATADDEIEYKVWPCLKNCFQSNLIPIKMGG